MLAGAVRRGVDVRVLTTGRETDNSLTQYMDSLFREDLWLSLEITLESFRRRSWLQQALERAASLLDRVL